MGLKQSIARLFGKTTPGGSSAGHRSAASGVVDESSPSGRRPVNIDVYLNGEADPALADEEQDLVEGMVGRRAQDAEVRTDASTNATDTDPVDESEPGGTLTRGPIVTPRNRQELVKELQKNYTEVVGLVRKVDEHLDLQTQRSERLLELAEQSARNLDVLPDLVEQNRRVADALGDLIELTRDARTRNDAAVDRLNKTAIQQLESGQRQTAALQSMQSAINRSNEAEQEMARSIGGFNETLADMSSSTRDLGCTISQMRETDAEREAELARLVSSGQKWLVAAVVFCALITVVVIGLAVNKVI